MEKCEIRTKRKYECEFQKKWKYGKVWKSLKNVWADLEVLKKVLNKFEKFGPAWKFEKSLRQFEHSLNSLCRIDVRFAREARETACDI